jgi:hypothetical protein
MATHAIPLCAALLCLGSTPASALPDWSRGENVVGATVRATAGTDDDHVDDDASFVVPEELGVSVDALATEAPSFASAHADVGGDFGESGGDGHASFELDIALDTPGPATASAELSWKAGLVPDVDGVFLFEYDVRSGEGWSFSTREPGGGHSSVELLGAGSLTRALVADQLFSVRLSRQVELSCLVECDESAYGYVAFRWAIVPEPSTFPLVGAGLLALGFARRERC